jgi:hypothetical protein
MRSLTAWMASGLPVVVLLLGQVHAANYYVATTGSAIAGSLSKPYKTIQKAAYVVQAGDTRSSQHSRKTLFARQEVKDSTKVVNILTEYVLY